MTLTIGHVTNLRVYTWDRASGDNVNITGTIVASDSNELTARRLQLAGMLNNKDENAFPLTWTVDSQVNGYYYVNDISVQRMGPEVSANARFTMSLTRVRGGYARPWFETTTTSTLRTNSFSVTSGDALWHAFYQPTTDGFYDVLADTNILGTGTILTSEDGSINGQTTTIGTSGAVSFGPASVFSYLLPSDYYKGTARFQVQIGSTWYNVHGRQIPILTNNWRITNGLCRIRPTNVSGAGRFTIEVYKSGAWVGREFFAGYGTGGVTTFPTSVTGTLNTGWRSPIILVNSPEQVVIRFAMTRMAESTMDPHQYDFSLRMGDTWAELTPSVLYTRATWRPGVGCSVSTASTNLNTGFIAATANDANGLRYQISTHRSFESSDTTNGSGYATGGGLGSVTFGITPDYQFGFASTSVVQRNFFYYARAAQKRVVPR